MFALYDSIGATYTASRQADPLLVATLADLLGLPLSGKYLDVACGAGNYTTALCAKGGTWTGIDASAVMLAQAHLAASCVSWLLADAAALPFEDSHFDGAICTLAIHHFKNLDRPFAEVKRALRSGPFVLFTAFPEQMQSYWLCHYFPSMMHRSIENMPSEQRVRESLSRAGFSRVEVTPYFVSPQLQDLFLYCGKDRPGLYFDEAIRANISSFAKLACSEELVHGLATLAEDFRTGRFAAVRAKYDSSGGDYAFLVARADG